MNPKSSKRALFHAPYNYFSKLWNLNRACEKFNLEHIYVTAQALDKDKSENFILYSSSSCKTYCLFFSQDIPLLGGRSVDVEKISQCTLKKKMNKALFMASFNRWFQRDWYIEGKGFGKTCQENYLIILWFLLKLLKSLICKFIQLFVTNSHR